MAIEIVDFPINSMVIFNSYVSLPEGISRYIQIPLSKLLCFRDRGNPVDPIDLHDAKRHRSQQPIAAMHQAQDCTRNTFIPIVTWLVIMVNSG